MGHTIVEHQHSATAVSLVARLEEILRCAPHGLPLEPASMLFYETSLVLKLHRDGTRLRARAGELEMNHARSRFVHDTLALCPQPDAVVGVLVVRRTELRIERSQCHKQFAGRAVESPRTQVPHSN